MLITTNAPTSQPVLGSEPLCPVLASSEVGILLRQLAHSIYVSDAMSTAAARCQQGALVVRGKGLRGEERGGGAGATYSTGRGERMIFRLRIHSRICVMLHRLPQQLLVRHAPVRVHACVRLCVHAHYRVRADVHVWV